MLLATQCPHCFTSFRVANDQLKLHAGLVRCGACQQTFNGIEYLLAPGAKPALPPTVTPDVAPVVISASVSAEAFSPVQVAIPEAHPEAHPATEAEIVAPFDPVENATVSHYAASSEQDQYQSAATSASSALEFDLGEDATFAPVAPLEKAEVSVAPETEPDIADDVHADSLTHTQLIDDDIDDGAAAEFQTEQAEVNIEDLNVNEEVNVEAPAKAWNAIVDVEANDIEDAEKPDFVIQAEKKQRRSRLVRVTMIILATLLFFALLAQATYGLRNQISAWFPQSKPVLQEACKYLRCRIELPTQIEVVLIESHELLELSKDKNIFSLDIQLQNKSNTLQAWPMLELILNDAKAKPVLRRVFTPADYLANKNDLVKGFNANSEQTIKLYFELSGPKVAGYNVGVFYP